MVFTAVKGGIIGEIATKVDIEKLTGDNEKLFIEIELVRKKVRDICDRLKIHFNDPAIVICENTILSEMFSKRSGRQKPLLGHYAPGYNSIFFETEILSGNTRKILEIIQLMFIFSMLTKYDTKGNLVSVGFQKILEGEEKKLESGYYLLNTESIDPEQFKIDNSSLDKEKDTLTKNIGALLRFMLFNSEEMIVIASRVKGSFESNLFPISGKSLDELFYACIGKKLSDMLIELCRFGNIKKYKENVEDAIRIIKSSKLVNKDFLKRNDNFSILLPGNLCKDNILISSLDEIKQ